MHRLHISPDGNVTSDTVHQLSRNSLGGVLFPKLESLYWGSFETDTSPTFFRLFLSPHLKHVTLRIPRSFRVPRSQSVPLIQIVSLLPTSLQHLSFMYCQVGGPLTDAMSSLVCRSDPSLRSFCSYTHLSETAVRHLTQLPNLHKWVTIQGPPQTVPLSIFPSLEELCLDEQAAIPWLHLLASSHGKDTLRNGTVPMTPPTNTREMLKILKCRDAPIDPTFLSSITKFPNLVTLIVYTNCPRAGSCAFCLTDDDMENITTTLPRLENLQLGRPCDSSSCNTTVASLLSVSTHCLGLTFLEVHFNTLTIVDDVQHLLDRDAGRDKSKCRLRHLRVGNLPFEVRGEDVKTVARWFRVVFPCLVDFIGYNVTVTWNKLKYV